MTNAAMPREAGERSNAMTTREFLRDKIEESLGDYRKGSPEVARLRFLST